MNDPVMNASQRTRNIRIVLFIVILGTLPLYCAGFFLWGTARPRAADLPIPATNTPIGSDVTATIGLPTVTPLALTPTILSPLQPTPLQFIPIIRPTFPPPTETPYLVPIIPTDTLAPTLTLIPSFTPFPTDTPQPSVTPPPTETDVPVVQPPTDTPLPFDDVPPPADSGTGDTTTDGTGSGG
ncbi:MAG: hypothetical protein R3E39_13710 [Anaerolineae bacterium]